MAARTFHRPSVWLAVLGFATLVYVCRAGEYAANLRQSTPGTDLACGQKDYQGNPQPFCRISGDVGQVADACDANPACFSFDMEGSYGGYLKGAGAQQYTEGFSNYCKLEADQSCAGSYTFMRRASIPGNNIDCRYKDYEGKLQPFCRINGDITDLAAACDANAECTAFDLEGSSIGYLKKAAGPTQYTEGFSVYEKRADGTPSSG
ncbi:hypothetical protein COO60DRAFT_1089994 [Scenedesmus sp. NREL 46B-D3]|nr:hypothetical protein COO60DRAFT_1089994 [Scenedesmus sp. NREL 46B-D3]